MENSLKLKWKVNWWGGAAFIKLSSPVPSPPTSRRWVSEAESSKPLITWFFW